MDVLRHLFFLFTFKIQSQLTKQVHRGGVTTHTGTLQHLPFHRHHVLTHAQRWKPLSTPPSKHACNLLERNGESV